MASAFRCRSCIGSMTGSDPLLSCRRARDQARVHRRLSLRVARRSAAGRRRHRRHGRAGCALSHDRPVRTLVARLGRSDVNRHRLCSGADRDAGVAGPGRTAYLPHRRGDRGRSWRNRGGGNILLGDLDLVYLMPVVGALAMLNRSHVYTLAPYVIVGVALWACVLTSGLHPTLAGVVLALFIPTRPPPNLPALTTQASAIIAAEAAHGGEVLRHGLSTPALRALDAIHDRLESPADRLLRHAGARSSYLVLPLFALANAGVALRKDTFSGRERLMARSWRGSWLASRSVYCWLRRSPSPRDSR